MPRKFKWMQHQADYARHSSPTRRCHRRRDPVRGTFRPPPKQTQHWLRRKISNFGTLVEIVMPISDQVENIEPDCFFLCYNSFAIVFNMALLSFRNILLLSAAYVVWKLLYQLVYYRFYHPLAKFPGPFWGSVTRLWITYHNVKEDECRVNQELHKKYGKCTSTKASSSQ